MNINNDLKVNQFFNVKTFTDGSQRLVIKQLNFIQRIVRALGFGYKNTQSKVVSHFVFDKVKNLSDEGLSDSPDWISVRLVNTLKNSIKTFQQKVPRHQNKAEMVVIYDKLIKNDTDKKNDLYPIKCDRLYHLPYDAKVIKEIDTSILSYFTIARGCEPDTFGSTPPIKLFSEDQWRLMSIEQIAFAFWHLAHLVPSDLQNIVTENDELTHLTQSLASYITFVARNNTIDESEKSFIFKELIEHIKFISKDIPEDIKNKYFESEIKVRNE